MTEPKHQKGDLYEYDDDYFCCLGCGLIMMLCASGQFICQNGCDEDDEDE